MTTILATADASSVDGLLGIGTKVLEWVITSMTSLLSFVTSHPVTLIGIVIGLIGVAFGFLFSALHRV